MTNSKKRKLEKEAKHALEYRERLARGWDPYKGWIRFAERREKWLRERQSNTTSKPVTIAAPPDEPPSAPVSATSEAESGILPEPQQSTPPHQPETPAGAGQTCAGFATT